MKKQDVRKESSYHIDGLSTVSFVLGLASVGFILYHVLQVIIS
ncbi:MAG: hypothetical protein ACRCYO_17210 [Bacteroidia bacterium]